MPEQRNNVKQGLQYGTPVRLNPKSREMVGTRRTWFCAGPSSLWHPNIALQSCPTDGPPQASLGHELSSFALGQDEDKTYSPWVSIAKKCPTPEQENVAETQRPVVSCNPIHSGLAESIGSAEMEKLGQYVIPDYSGSPLSITSSGLNLGPLENSLSKEQK